MSQTRKEFSAQLVVALSGDDLVVLLDLGVEDLYKRQRVRLKGVDTPSAINKDIDTDAGRLRAEVQGLLKGRELIITVVNRGAVSWVVDLHYLDPGGCKKHLNKALIDMGYEYKRGEDGDITT